MKHAALAQGPTPQGLAVATDDALGNHAAYEEYVRGFDDVPVLQDVVRIPPPRRQQPDFRRGERRDAREEQRADGYSLREAMLAEIELLYQEYAQPAPLAARPKRKKRQTAKGKKRPMRRSKKH